MNLYYWKENIKVNEGENFFKQCPFNFYGVKGNQK